MTKAFVYYHLKFSQRNPSLIIFVLEGPRDGVDVTVEDVCVLLDLGKEFGEGILGLLYDASIHLDYLIIVLKGKESYKLTMYRSNNIENSGLILSCGKMISNSLLRFYLGLGF